MTSASLLNLNVDTLFEQHSVAEIDIVQKKIHNEIEKKREELRTMVGERYRDLLKAADTITTMRVSSELLIKQIDCITANCKSLNEKQLIGFETVDTVDLAIKGSANKELNKYFSTMIQIKLLINLPEMIWSHIDNERMSVAAELFIFSRHISTGLQLDLNNTLMKYLPVAKKQWEILKPFHVAIKQKVLSILEREQLSAETATDCLMTLFLLEKNTLNGALKIFLQLRTAAFLKSLSDNSSSDQKRVKDRILGSLMVLNSTMNLVLECFFDSGDGQKFGLVTQKLKNHSETNPLPTLALMDSSEIQFSYMLPDIIANFHPKIETQNFDKDQGYDTIKQFLADSSNIAGVNLKDLFELIPSLNGIQDIKKESLTLESQKNFATICTKLHLAKEIDFYNSLYAPLIAERIRNIIRQLWSCSVDNIVSKVDSIVKSIGGAQETAYSSNLWIENKNDLPLNLDVALNEDKKMKKLLMRIRGYDGAIVSTCQDFDQQIQGIVKEINVLLEDENTRAEEKLSLIQFLREISLECICAFISRIQELNFNESRHQLLFILHLLPAILELCPNLKICLSQTNSWRQFSSNSTTVISSSEYWNRVCILIEKETTKLWSKIISIILDENNIESFMSSEIGFDTILLEFPNWETITLEQKDEIENSIQSTFRIPTQPRTSLQEYLLAVIRSLSKTVPQTLPGNILTMFNKKLFDKLIECYKLQANHQFTATNQNMALQLYFDLKFLQMMLSSREDRTTIDNIQKICRNLKDFIDPFDFELFSEHITNNIKRAAGKMSHQFGVISMNTQQSSAASVNAQQEKDPNVLSLSSNGSMTIWFPLLPIIEPGNRDKKRPEMKNESASIVQVEKISPSRSSQRRSDTAGKQTQNVGSNVKSGAAAFFGAMSQDWFR